MDNNNKGRRKLLAWGSLGAVLGLGGFGLYRHFSSTAPMKVESFISEGDGSKKNILILTGGGRVNGNSEILAAAFEKGAKDAGHNVSLFQSGFHSISSCRHCERCWSDGEPCVIKDDFSDLRPMLEEAEMLVCVSPLYWYNMSGFLKCAIDRFYPWSSKKRPANLKIREAMLLMCGESHFPRSFAGAAESWRQILGLKHWKDRGRLFVTGVNEYGAMRGNKALETAREMGEKA